MCALIFPAWSVGTAAPLTFAPLKNADGTLGLAASAAGGASVSQPAPLRAAFWDGALAVRRPAPAEWRYDKGPDPKTTGSLRVAGEKVILTGDFSKGGKRFVAAVCPVAFPEATQAVFTVKTDQRHLMVRLVDATGQRHQQTHAIRQGAPDTVTVPFNASTGSLSWGGADDDILHLPLRALEILVNVHDSGATGTAEISGARFVNETIPAPAVAQGGYATLRETAAGEWLGTGTLKAPDNAGAGSATLAFTDRWTVSGDTLRLRREVRVRSAALGGFGTVAALQITGARPWPEMEWFVPGNIYGNSDHLRPNSFGSANYYKPGDYTVWMREDRLPAPLLAARLPGGASIAVLNSAPDGATNAADGLSFTLAPLASESFRFGAIIAEERPASAGVVTTIGCAFPGSEGTLTYGPKSHGHAVSSVQHWRYRFSPLQDGFTQRHEVTFRLATARDTNDLVAQNWRWAWQTLRPQVNPQPLETLRRCMADVLLENVIERDGVTGIRQAAPSEANPIPAAAVTKSVLGFTGYALGSAEMMLAEAAHDPVAPRSQKLRAAAEKIIATFLTLPVAPPVAEGFVLGGENHGALAADQNPSAKPLTDATPIYLRSFCDDMKSLMRAYTREKKAGRDHPEWLAWVRRFGDWLLAQQQPAGGFPRSWHAVTGAPFDTSSTGAFLAVPFFTQLYQLTEYTPCLDAALRTGEFAWDNGHARARFTGGTIDNPNVLDKEAATISLEGYLALHAATRDPKWLARARAAADIAETWMYAWDVPRPADAAPYQLHWPAGQTTAGMQLIATGHSGADAYMAWDVASYARLARETGDPHYLEVARILLHNTKALAGRPGDLRGTRGPGWQQENCWLSLPRGRGRHRAWLPWVTVSQLRGINDLLDLDPALYRQLAGAAAGEK
jgi:hypothetical protein